MSRLGLSITLTGLVALVSGLPAMAADNGFYLGASVGQSALRTSDELEDIEISGEDMAFKVFAGYRFLTFLAVEGSYLDLGAPDDTLPGLDGTVEIDVTGFDAFAVGLLPLGVADIFVKAGMIAWEAELNADIAGFPETLSDDGTAPAYGVGLQFRIGSFAIRGELEYFDIEDTDDVYMYSIGGSFTF